MNKSKQLKYAICTEASDYNFPYLRVMLYSLIKHNSWIKDNIVLLTCDLTPLSSHNRKIISSICENVSYIDIDCSDYKLLNIKNKDRNKLLTNLYRTHALGLKGYDFVMYISSLSLCISPIESLFRGDADILVGNSGINTLKERQSKKTDAIFNSSLMLISKDILISDTKHKILNRLEKFHNISSENICNSIRDEIKLNSFRILYSNPHKISKKSKYPDSKTKVFSSIKKNVVFIELDIGVNEKRKTSSHFMFKNMNSLWKSYNIQGDWNFEESVNQSIKITSHIERVKKRKINNSSSNVISVNEENINISVIIPAHRAQNYIGECVSSIIRQNTQAKIEIIIGVDNCKSTEESVEKLITKYNNVRAYKTEHNVGPYIIRNSLIEKASYDDILFFDADDVMQENMISTILKNYSKSSPIRFKYYNFKNGDDYTRFKKLHTDIAHGVFFSNIDILKRLGGFKGWMCGADTELMKRCRANGIRDINISIPIFYRRIHKGSLTQNANTNHRSNVRKKAQRYINTNRNWKIPIETKTINMKKI